MTFDLEAPARRGGAAVARNEKCISGPLLLYEAKRYRTGMSTLAQGRCRPLCENGRSRWAPRQMHGGPLMSLEEIASNFELLDDWEDRYRYVIELGRQLPPLDEALKSEATKVRGCASQVWLVSREATDGNGLPPRLIFEGDSDAHIVRGLVAILLAAVAGKSAAEIVALDLPAIFARLGLRENLTPQRSNGLASMISRIRADAQNVLSKQS